MPTPLTPSLFTSDNGFSVVRSVVPVVLHPRRDDRDSGRVLWYWELERNGKEKNGREEKTRGEVCGPKIQKNQT